jgi:hypothetical protein
MLDLPVRQRLLEEHTTADRLRSELALLRSEIRLIDAFQALPGVELTRGQVNSN